MEKHEILLNPVGGGALSGEPGCQEVKRAGLLQLFLAQCRSALLYRHENVMRGFKDLLKCKTSPHPSPTLGEGVQSLKKERVTISCVSTVNSLPSCLLALRKCYAFTLAEVLITLAIIGVVAAMTMPSLIAKYKHKAYEVQFKVAHSLISQALEHMAKDVDDISYVYCGNGRPDVRENIFIQDFARYFNVIRSNYVYTSYLKNLGYKDDYFKRSGNGNYNFNTDSHDNGAIWLKNGMFIASSGCWWAHKYVDFIVDTNGFKGPNKFGYDVFYFQVGDNNKLYPSAGNYLLNNSTDERMKQCCNFLVKGSTCSGDNGSSCALYALQNVSPHDSSKGYWESLP